MAKNRITSKFVRLARSAVLRANYLLHNYDEVIWVLGDGRSGTTWLSGLLNHNNNYRDMFEPFHPTLVADMDFLLPHQYVRQEDTNEKLLKIASDVFTGKFTDPRVDFGNRSLVYNGLLIKDIFANLLCYWAKQHFPHIKPVIIIRNPFSVALSKSKKKDWFWVTEPLDFLKQEALYKDFMSPFEETIRKTSEKKNLLLNHVLIWAIVNYVPLRQFKPGEIHFCFYEDLFSDPVNEVKKIFNYVKGPAKSHEIHLATDIINRPSHVTDDNSTLLSPQSPIMAWKNEFPAARVDDGLKILEKFGLDCLYDDRSMPDKNVINEFRN